MKVPIPVKVRRMGRWPLGYLGSYQYVRVGALQDTNYA